MKPLRFSRFAVAVPDGWDDVTNDTNPTGPVTLADPISGVGALQLSIASYRSGRRPNVTLEHLKGMIQEFAATHGLRDGFDQSSATTPVCVAGMSFRKEGDFIRVWYVTDGASVGLITYVCAWASNGLEASSREAIVGSLRFKSANKQPGGTANRR